MAIFRKPACAMNFNDPDSRPQIQKTRYGFSFGLDWTRFESETPKIHPKSPSAFLKCPAKAPLWGLRLLWNLHLFIWWPSDFDWRVLCRTCPPLGPDEQLGRVPNTKLFWGRNLSAQATTPDDQPSIWGRGCLDLTEHQTDGYFTACLFSPTDSLLVTATREPNWEEVWNGLAAVFFWLDYT